MSLAVCSISGNSATVFITLFSILRNMHVGKEKLNTSHGQMTWRKQIHIIQGYETACISKALLLAF